jgi:putative transcriptional regulator
MIIVKFKQCLEDKERLDDKKISLEEVAIQSGIGRATLTRIVNKIGYNAELNVVDKLCDYFDCEIADLLYRVKKTG